MMNRSREAAGEGFRAPRRVSNFLKDKDVEELSFFRDLQKREKDHGASLLQPVSEEFEADGNYALRRMDDQLGGRKLEYFLGDGGKNDYNWLKTPPATPLFPSLEMETNGQELIVQREIPIIQQPLSRFAGNPGGSKPGTNTSSSSSSANPKPKLPQRHKTTPAATSDKRNMKTAPVITNQTVPSLPNKVKPYFPSSAKPNIPPPSKSIALEPKPKTRGLSPAYVRPTIRSGHGLLDETPPNLRTTMSNRPASATRGRPSNLNLPALQQKGTDPKIRRQSCSPSVTRGRKVDAGGNARQLENNEGQVLGSRMVERFMNARAAEERQSRIKMNASTNEINSRGEDRQTKIKLNGSLNESSGFGRLVSKNSLDMALRHMEVQRDSSSARKHRVKKGI